MVLATGVRLAGQRGLLDLQPGALDDAPVGGHPRPGGEDDDVARAPARPRGPGAPRPSRMTWATGDGLLLEGGEGLLGLPLGQEADERVQDDDDQDGDRLDVLAQREGHRGRRDQQDHDEALELVDEDREGRPRPPSRPGRWGRTARAGGPPRRRSSRAPARCGRAGSPRQPAACATLPRVSATGTRTRAVTSRGVPAPVSDRAPLPPRCRAGVARGRPCPGRRPRADPPGRQPLP